MPEGQQGERASDRLRVYTGDSDRRICALGNAVAYYITVTQS